MDAPTLYFLSVYQRETGEYEIWERHCGQEKGCVPSDDQFINLVNTKTEVQAIIDNWRIHPPAGGVLENVNWHELPQLEDIELTEISDCHDVYSDYPEMINAICALKGLKAYRIVRNGDFRGYTFEVVE